MSKMTTQSSPDDDSGAPATATVTSNDTHILRQICRRHDELEAQYSLQIQNMLPMIKDATAELREACVDGAANAQAVLEGINNSRWRRPTGGDEACREAFHTALARLEVAFATFKEKNRHMLIEPYIPLLKEARTKEERQAVPLRSLYIAYVFATNLMMVADGLLAVMVKVRDTTAERERNTLWAPKGLRALKKLFTEREHEDGAEFGEDRSPETPEKNTADESYREFPLPV